MTSFSHQKPLKSKNKKHRIFWNTEFYHPAKFELKRIKNAKVVTTLQLFVCVLARRGISNYHRKTRRHISPRLVFPSLFSGGVYERGEWKKHQKLSEHSDQKMCVCKDHILLKSEGQLHSCKTELVPSC